MRIEVAVPTRGRVGFVLAGLLPHAVHKDSTIRAALRVVTERPLRDAWELGLLETFQHLGWQVVVSLQTGRGPGAARAQAALESNADYMVYLDDDAVLVGEAVLLKLVAMAAGHGWATPIIRFVQGFSDPPAGHTELWCQTTLDAPAVVRAISARGFGWARVFDVNAGVYTDQLNGTCFAVRRELLVPHLGSLENWRSECGWSDDWLGRMFTESNGHRRTRTVLKSHCLRRIGRHRNDNVGSVETVT